MRWLLPVLMFAFGMAEETRADWDVWTVCETRRVLRDEQPGRAKDVLLAAARREWESFQILVRSDEPIRGIDIKPGDLRGPGGYVLRAADARLYRQHSLHVKVGTSRHPEFQPDWYPDALIPFRHPTTRQPLDDARFVAVPFDLPAEQTHGFWVDIGVPEDAPAGEYRGRYRVKAADGRERKIPVEMTVWDFALPRVSALRTALGAPASKLRGYYAYLARNGRRSNPPDWPAVDRQCAEMLSRHRINVAPPPMGDLPVVGPDGTFAVPPEVVAAFRRFVDTYHVNALQLPHPKTAIRDPIAERDRLWQWLAAWDRAADELNRPGVLFYIYLKDEPNDAAAYAEVRRWGEAIRAADSVVQVLVVEQTWPQQAAWGDIYGAVDIWCPLFSGFRADSASRRQAAGETVWTYTALCQGEPTPWWQIDRPLLNYRVPAWIAWRSRIRGLLYWGNMCYWDEVADPWTEPATFHTGGGFRRQIFNGEGTLVYPGHDVGYDGLAPSLRLKALRDAVEDYDYLYLLEKAGRAEDAERLVAPLVRDWFTWNTAPEAYEQVRRNLAARIAAVATN